MRTTLVWFKTDLRLHDNETLVRAIENSDQIVPVYCFDETHFRQTEFGFRKTGAFRTQFILETLRQLDHDLRQLNSGLIVVKGDPAEELFKLVKKFNATKIYAKKEVAYEELQTQMKVEEKVWKLNCTLEVFSTSTLYHPADLPFSIKDIPDVFTDFRRRVEKETTVRNIFDKPLQIASPSLPAMQLSTLSDLHLNKVEFDNRAAIFFQGGENKAIERMNYYFDKSKLASTYKETRNQLIGSDYSTKFSAWLAIGCISPRYIYYSLKKYEEQYGSNDSTYWIVFELLWRDFFRFMMKKHREKFFLKYGIKDNNHTIGTLNKELLMKWVNGKTGDDFVDANMRELKHSGFMSNRGRQNAASYLCHNLKIDWRSGAAYFEEQLIDYDVSSNWGNWSYIAGVGNDPRPNRYFNTEKQSKMYDAEKKYVNLWK